MDIGINVWAVVVVDGVGGGPAGKRWRIIPAAEINEAGFRVVAFAGEAPGVVVGWGGIELLAKCGVFITFVKGAVRVEKTDYIAIVIMNGDVERVAEFKSNGGADFGVFRIAENVQGDKVVFIVDANLVVPVIKITHLIFGHTAIEIVISESGRAV